VLPLSTQVCGFKPVRIFQGEKIPSTHSFGGEVKPSVPCRRFVACKISLNVTWKSAFKQNYRPTLWPQFHLSLLGSLASDGRGQGCTISLISCGASAAYAPGSDEEDLILIIRVLSLHFFKVTDSQLFLYAKFYVPHIAITTPCHSVCQNFIFAVQRISDSANSLSL